MAQIYSHLALPSPLPERTSICQKVEKGPYPSDLQTSVPKRYAERISQDYRNSSKSPSPILTYNYNMHIKVMTPKSSEEHQPCPELGHPRESLPPLRSILNGLGQQHMISVSSSRNSPPIHSSYGQQGRQSTTVSHSRARSHGSSKMGKIDNSCLSFSSDTLIKNSIRINLPPPSQLQSHNDTPRSKSPTHDTGQNMLNKLKSQSSCSFESWSSQSYPCHLDSVQMPPLSCGIKSKHYSSPKNSPELEKLKVVEFQNFSTPANSSEPCAAENPAIEDDGLGPRIWTGNRFLPRFTHERFIPGEGKCYFYDDGSHCKAVIDGEVVNAHWGVTKTGKPRKRLAIACMTCREKKIKCDPNYPRCVQCEKFGRACKFKNAPRGSQSLPGTPFADITELPIQQSSIRDEETIQVKRESTQSVSPRQTVVRHEILDNDIHHQKRQKNGYCEFTPTFPVTSPRYSVKNLSSPSTPFVEKNKSFLFDSTVSSQLQTNPYVLCPEFVTDLLNIFFKFVPETISGIFAEVPFRNWALTPTSKSLDDNTTLYAILCLASVFSPNPDVRAKGGLYAQNCRLGCEDRPFSLQLVHSRLLLALYYFTSNESDLAWDICGSAMRAASKLKLNLELEKSDETHRKHFPYDLSRAGYAECRRRTFWGIYLIDRFNTFCAGYNSVLKAEDIFLRLPCDMNSFESQIEVNTPFFDPTNVSIPGPNWKIGCWGYLINIATIWGDVLASIYRSSLRGLPSSSVTFVRFYENITHRMREWDASLPACYRATPENIQLAANNGVLGIMVTMHAVYHNTGMKLNRYIPHLNLTNAQVNHHITSAHQHAESLLVIMDILYRLCILNQTPKLHDRISPKFTSPFIGYCVVSAVDILTAMLPVSSIPSRLDSFQSSLAILSELSIFWRSSIHQRDLVQKRLLSLTHLTTERANLNPTSAGALSNDGICAISEPLEQIFARKDDCIYRGNLSV
ncbi:hypothetical protein Golomagni_00637 [Golovinomyces magnicellulatus]|nr:hypothetical protein Golomagni_00637 [Golovinomyces magnicellulatus]